MKLLSLLIGSLVFTTTSFASGSIAISGGGPMPSIYTPQDSGVSGTLPTDLGLLLNTTSSVIPHLGIQTMTQGFPSGTGLAISPSARITNVFYAIHFTDTDIPGVSFSLKYDNTAMMGSTTTTSTSFFDTSGTGIIHSSTTAFNTLHPYSNFSVLAQDVSGAGAGEIDSINFEVNWIDYPDFQFTTAMGSNTATLTDSRNLSVTGTLYNNSNIDNWSNFSTIWYLTPNPSGNGTCTTHVPFSTSAFYVGNFDTHLFWNNYVEVQVTKDLTESRNGFGEHLTASPSNCYCLMATADYNGAIPENDETNNGQVYPDAVCYNPDLTRVNTPEVAAIKTYPNPTSDRLTIELQKDATTASVQIFDEMGRMIQLSQPPTVSGRSIVLSVKDLSAGTYGIRIQNADASASPVVTTFVKR